jgi:hypothetical protein
MTYHRGTLPNHGFPYPDQFHKIVRNQRVAPMYKIERALALPYTPLSNKHDSDSKNVY